MKLEDALAIKIATTSMWHERPNFTMTQAMHEHIRQAELVIATRFNKVMGLRNVPSLKPRREP